MTTPDPTWVCPTDHDYLIAHADALSVTLCCCRCGKGITHITAAAIVMLGAEALRSPERYRDEPVAQPRKRAP